VPKDPSRRLSNKNPAGIRRRIERHGHIALMAQVPATPACFPAYFLRLSQRPEGEIKMTPLILAAVTTFVFELAGLAAMPTERGVGKHAIRH
jgi:hypothetical protein